MRQFWQNIWIKYFSLSEKKCDPPAEITKGPPTIRKHPLISQTERWIIRTFDKSWQLFNTNDSPGGTGAGATPPALQRYQDMAQMLAEPGVVAHTVEEAKLKKIMIRISKGLSNNDNLVIVSVLI